ncbi:MAG: ion transporter [Blautia sp.]|nr:ion transporter [Blautia sp.]
MAASAASRKKRIFDIIQIGNVSDIPSRAFDIFLVIVILLNITVMVLQTFDGLKRFDPLFNTIENVTIFIFIIEYILRIWTADYLYPQKDRGHAVLSFIFSFDGIVELLTILPFFFLSGFVAFRMLRVVRIFHLFRINANYDSFNAITSVLYEKRNQLVSSLFIILVLMLAASLFMYSAEHEAQPDVFENAFSGIWWSVSTLLTVGYGDIYPITFTGKVLAIIIAFLGVAAVAVPTGIISAGFVEQYTRLTQEDGMKDLVLGLQAIVINLDSSWIGQTIDEVQKKSGTDIVLVAHHRKSFVPDKEYRIQLGDTLAVHFPKQ